MIPQDLTSTQERQNDPSIKVTTPNPRSTTADVKRSIPQKSSRELEDTAIITKETGNETLTVRTEDDRTITRRAGDIA